MKSLVVFFVGGLAFGAISLTAGMWLIGSEDWIPGGTAFGLTFLPALATLAWVVYSYRASPELQLAAALGGSGIRMGIALGGGYFLTQQRPDEFDTTFWAWLAWFYLVLLAFEITLLVRQQPATGPSSQA